MTPTNHEPNREAICWLEASLTLANGLYKYEMRGLCLPILAIKDSEDTCPPMEIVSTDYDDSMRWWL
jgi:hypothetical protein